MLTVGTHHPHATRRKLQSPPMVLSLITSAPCPTMPSEQPWSMQARAKVSMVPTRTCQRKPFLSHPFPIVHMLFIALPSSINILNTSHRPAGEMTGSIFSEPPIPKPNPHITRHTCGPKPVSTPKALRHSCRPHSAVV